MRRPRNWMTLAVVGIVICSAGAIIRAAEMERPVSGKADDAVVRAYTLKQVPAEVCAAAVRDMVSVRTDQLTNSIIVKGPRRLQQQVRRVVDDLDGTVRPALFETMANQPVQQLDARVSLLKHAESKQVALNLRLLFDDQQMPHRVTWLSHNNAVLMRGTADELNQMEALITALDVPARQEAAGGPEWVTEVVRMQHGQSLEIGDLVVRWLVDVPRQFPPRVVPDERLNAFIIHGRPDMVSAIIELIRKLDVPVTEPK